MKTRGWILVFLLLTISEVVFSQQKTPPSKTVQQMGIADLKKLSRKELIDRAVRHINDPEFKMVNYDRIKVMANSSKMYVTFDVAVRYIPVLTSYYIPVYVDMVNQKISIKEISNSGFFSSVFYDSPKLYEKQVKSVIDDIVKSPDGSQLLPEKKVTDNTTVTIREVYGHFEVEVESPGKITTCKIDKVSGKLSAISNSVLPAKKENSFSEIK